MGNLDKYIWRRFGIIPQVGLPYIGRKGTRNTLASLFAEVGFNHGAEIGVYRGEFSEVLCKANSNLKLICVDNWTVYLPTHRQSSADAAFRMTQNRLAPYGVEIKRMDSMDAVKEIPEQSLDFVYIDADHEFDGVMPDLIEWSKRVRPGGIVSGHDYFHFRQCEVPQAVDAYTRAHNIHQWYITRQDNPQSWFWVKT